MKISIEFESIKDLLIEMPKFAQLIAGGGSFEDRAAMAIDAEAPVIKITPTDGKPFTEEEKEKIAKAVGDHLSSVMNPPVDEEPAPAAPKEKAKKNTAEAKKPEKGAPDEPPVTATETEARAALNGLVKSRGNAAVKLVFKKLEVSNFGELTADQYAEALKLAELVGNMGDDEYEAALKKEGIKGGKK